jgi:hypothetical protein
MKIVKFPRNNDIFKYKEKHGLHVIDCKPKKDMVLLGKTNCIGCRIYHRIDYVDIPANKNSK